MKAFDTRADENSSLPTLLIVDDEKAHMMALCHTLGERGYKATGYSVPEEALEALKAQDFDLLLTDLMMPTIGGIDLLRAAQTIRPGLVGVLMTGHGTIDTAVEAMKVGALDYILKPFKLSGVIPVLERALAVRRLRVENAVLQKRIQERTRELEEANQDLEAFGWSVSHDLMAPVRGVRGYLGLLKRDYEAVLPDAGKDYLRKIGSSAERMEQMLKDLLQFAKSGSSPILKESFSLRTLIETVVSDLKEQEPGRMVEVRIDELGLCAGDPSLLRHVLYNLLSNAFKFTKNVEGAVIHVSCKDSETESVYTVRDNGAGFDMKYAHRLFGVFQRLHRDSEFSGNGVGLSIVRRIIERHGGRIWVEAALGQGAAFHFALPKT